MITYSRQQIELDNPASQPASDEHIAPAPRVSVQAFCETVEAAAAVHTGADALALLRPTPGAPFPALLVGGMPPWSSRKPRWSGPVPCAAAPPSRRPPGC